MKRFTETNKWDDPWFIRLPLPYKLLWIYLCDRCDRSGVIDFSSELASIQIGNQVSEQDLLELGNRLQKLPNGKWRIMKFLSFQYGTIDARCPAHKPVIRLIEANGIKYPINNNPSYRLFNNLKEEEENREYPIKNLNRPMTKYGLPLPPRCSIRKDGEVLDYTGRVMDINQVRAAANA
jgi:hypothetical protein